MTESEAEKEEKRVKVKKVAEDAGELDRKGVRKTGRVVKGFGKGLVRRWRKRKRLRL